MARGGNRDVQLVIRARDEAGKAIEGITGALSSLFGVQEKVSGSASKVGGNLEQLGGLLQQATGFYSKIDAAANAASAAFERQSAAISETRAQLQSVNGQAESAGRAIEALKVKLVDATLEGGDAGGVRAQIKQIEAQQRGLVAQAARLNDTLGRQQAALDGSRSALQQTGSVANAAETEIAALTAEIERQTAALREQEAAAVRTSDVQQRINRLTGVSGLSGGSAADSASLLREAGEMDAAAERLRAKLNPAIEVERHLNAELEQTTKLFRAGRISADEYAQAQEHLAKEARDATAALNKGGASGASFLGLRGYQLQNLQFQANDLVTQLASGTSIARALGQQGGQIIQLFPRVQSAILGAFGNPVVLGFTAALGTIVIGVKELSDQAEKLRKFDGILTANADAAIYQSRGLAAAEKAISNYGASAADAAAAVKTFLSDDVTPERLQEFGIAAQDAADVLGLKMPEAAKKIAQAFTGGFDAIKTLDDEQNVYSATQLETIRNMFEEGRASDARTLALNVYSEKMHDAAQKSEGPWSKAFRSVGQAWQSFTESLANTTPIQEAANLLDGLANKAKNLFDRLRDGGTMAERIAREQANIAAIEGQLAEYRKAGRAPPFGYTQEDLDRARAHLAVLQAEAKADTANAKKDPRNDESQRQEKAAQDRLAAIAAQKERDALTESKRMDAGRIAQAGQLAFEAEMRKSGDARIAAAERELAVQKETEKVEQLRKQAAKEKARAEEEALRTFRQNVIAAEGGTAKNPNSSAKGFGQFTEGTFKEQFNKVFPDKAGLSDAQKLALRDNKTVAAAIIDNYARENARFLKSFGAEVTAGNLYLAHFLGAAGAKKILTADPNTTVDKLLSQDVINRNKGYLAPNGKPRTAGGLKTFLAGRMGETSAAQSAGVVELSKLESDRQDKQDAFNLKVAQENEQRRIGTENLKEQAGLIGNALLAKEREQAMADAIAEKERELVKINEDLVKNGQEPIIFTKELRDEVIKTTGAYFDLQHAKQAAQNERGLIDDGVANLTTQRASIQEQQRVFREKGQPSFADNLNPQLDAVTAKLQTAIAKAQEFYAALAGDPERQAQLGLTVDQITNIQLGLQTAALTAQNFGQILGIAFTDVAQALTDDLTTAFSGFLDAIGKGQNVVRSLGQAFVQLAATFLRQIAMMILKQIALNIVMAIGRVISGGAPVGGGGGGAGLGAIGGLQGHAGGVIGRGALASVGNGIASVFGSGARSVNPAWFSNAREFHNGGFPGLRPDEVPIIAQKGEEILSRTNPRNALNGGGSGGGSGKGDVKVNVLLDPADMLEQALSSSAGERIFNAHLRNNQVAIKGALES